MAQLGAWVSKLVAAQGSHVSFAADAVSEIGIDQEYRAELVSTDYYIIQEWPFEEEGKERLLLARVFRNDRAHQIIVRRDGVLLGGTDGVKADIGYLGRMVRYAELRLVDCP